MAGGPTPAEGQIRPAACFRTQMCAEDDFYIFKWLKKKKDLYFITYENLRSSNFKVYKQSLIKIHIPTFIHLRLVNGCFRAGARVAMCDTGSMVHKEGTVYHLALYSSSLLTSAPGKCIRAFPKTHAQTCSRQHYSKYSHKKTNKLPKCLLRAEWVNCHLFRQWNNT